MGEPHRIVAFFVAAAAALSMGACTYKRPRCTAYHFGETFPTAYQGAAREALVKWSAFSGVEVSIDEDGDPKDNVCAFRAIKSDSAEYASYKANTGGGDFFAMHDANEGSIILAEEQWPNDQYCVDDRVACAHSILMHETAHEFGLMHIDDPAAVMGTTNAHPRTEYNESDRAELLRVRPFDHALDR